MTRREKGDRHAVLSTSTEDAGPVRAVDVPSGRIAPDPLRSTVPVLAGAEPFSVDAGEIGVVL